MTNDTNKKIISNLCISLIIILLAYAFCYVYIDRPLSLGLYHQAESWKQAAILVGKCTDTSVWIALAILAALTAFIGHISHRISKKASKKLYGFSASIFLAYVIAGVIKVCLARYRPELLFSHHLYGFHFFSIKHNFNSTPSGHTTGAFAALFFISAIINKKPVTIALLLLATLIGLCRVVALAHYFSDVLLGAYIGISSVYIIQRLNYFSR